MPKIRVFLLGHAHHNPAPFKHVLKYVNDWKQQKPPKKKLLLADEITSDMTRKTKIQDMIYKTGVSTECHQLMQLLKTHNNSLTAAQKVDFLNTKKGTQIDKNNLERFILAINQPNSEKGNLTIRNSIIDTFFPEKAFLELLLALGEDIPYIAIDVEKKQSNELEQALLTSNDDSVLDLVEPARISAMKTNLIKRLKEADMQGFDVDVFVMNGMAHIHQLAAALSNAFNEDPFFMAIDIQVVPILSFLLEPTYFYGGQEFHSLTLKNLIPKYSTIFNNTIARFSSEAEREYCRCYPTYALRSIQNPSTHQFECADLDTLVAGKKLAYGPLEEMDLEVRFKTRVNTFLEIMEKRHPDTPERDVIVKYREVFNDPKHTETQDYIAAHKEAWREAVIKALPPKVNAKTHAMLADLKSGLGFHRAQYTADKAREKAKIRRETQAGITANWAKIAFAVADQRVNAQRPKGLCPPNLIFSDIILKFAGLKAIEPSHPTLKKGQNTPN